MSLTPEHEIKRRVLAPGLESKATPVDTTRPAADKDGIPLSRKTVHPRDEEVEETSPDDHDQTSELISVKHQRLDNGTAQVVRHRREGANVLTQYGVSYGLNHRGTGVFVLKKQKRTNSNLVGEVRAKHVG